MRDVDDDNTTHAIAEIRAAWLVAAEAFGEVVRIGPFACTFDARDPLVWLNYAVPFEDVDDEALAAR